MWPHSVHASRCETEIGWSRTSATKSNFQISAVALGTRAPGRVDQMAHEPRRVVPKARRSSPPQGRV